MNEFSQFVVYALVIVEELMTLRSNFSLKLGQNAKLDLGLSYRFILSELISDKNRQSIRKFMP